MAETKHLRLSVTEQGEDLPFLDWRQRVTDSTDSNMVKLDEAYGTMQQDMSAAMETALGGLGWDENTNSLVLYNLRGGKIATLPVKYTSTDPIEITRFSHSVGTVEVGNVVNNITFTMTFSEEAVSLTLNGEPIEIGTYYVLSGQTITDTTEFTLIAKDRWGNVDSAQTTVTFGHGLYYGVDVMTDTFTSDWILGLSKQIRANRNTTFSVSAADEEYVYFALPADYGVPTFEVGGFAGGFAKVGTIQFVNSHDHEASYDIYRSDNDGLRNLTVEVI